MSIIVKPSTKRKFGKEGVPTLILHKKLLVESIDSGVIVHLLKPSVEFNGVTARSRPSGVNGVTLEMHVEFMWITCKQI